MPAGRGVCTVLVLALALAGCLGVGTGIDRSFEREAISVDDGVRGPEEFWMVSIRGNETDEREPQAVCGRVGVPFELLRHNDTVRYDPDRTDVDPDEVQILLAVRHEDLSSACPEAIALAGDPPEGQTFDMGQWGRLAVRVYSNGTVQAGGHWIPLGQVGQFSYEGSPPDPDVIRVDGQFKVVNLGAWDREDLWARSP